MESGYRVDLGKGLEQAFEAAVKAGYDLRVKAGRKGLIHSAVGQLGSIMASKSAPTSQAEMGQLKEFYTES